MVKSSTTVEWHGARSFRNRIPPRWPKLTVSCTSTRYSQGHPIPYADQAFDDGLPSQQWTNDDDTTSETVSDEEDLAAPTSVPNGNGLPFGLEPLEHVQLSVAVSRIPHAKSIPDDILGNLHYLFNKFSIVFNPLRTNRSRRCRRRATHRKD